MPDSLFVDLYAALWARLFGLERYARKSSPGQMSLFGEHDVSQEPRDAKGEWTAGGAAPKKSSDSGHANVEQSGNRATIKQEKTPAIGAATMKYNEAKKTLEVKPGTTLIGLDSMTRPDGMYLAGMLTIPGGNRPGGPAGDEWQRKRDEHLSSLVAGTGLRELDARDGGREMIYKFGFLMRSSDGSIPAMQPELRKAAIHWAQRAGESDLAAALKSAKPDVVPPQDVATIRQEETKPALEEQVMTQETQPEAVQKPLQDWQIREQERKQVWERFNAEQVKRLETQPTKAVKAKTLPKKGPSSIQFRSRKGLDAALKSKYVPREATDGEVIATLGRPQVGPYDFLEYKPGDVIFSDERNYVVQAVKPGYTRSGEGWKVWEQSAVLRLATPVDLAAIAAQKAEQDKAGQAVMDRMMNS